jgi:hypothetical protein
MNLSKYPTLERAIRQQRRELILWLVGAIVVVAIVLGGVFGGDKMFGVHIGHLGSVDYLLLLIVVLLWECLVELRSINKKLK